MLSSLGKVGSLQKSLQSLVSVSTVLCRSFSAVKLNTIAFVFSGALSLLATTSEQKAIESESVVETPPDTEQRLDEASTDRTRVLVLYPN